MTWTGSETGKTVYERTYSRTKPDGSKETWPETVRRVVDGNLALVDHKYHGESEREDLITLMESFDVIPAGRHLWTSGVKGRQFSANCHVSSLSEGLKRHHSFTFLRLMEGGGVGANYGTRYLPPETTIQSAVKVHITCDPSHPDYNRMKAEGLLSEQYSHWWGDGHAVEVEDSREGWASALTDLIDALLRPVTHLNRVFDVSRVRPSGARLKQFGGTASGPLPLAKMLRNVATIYSTPPDALKLMGYAPTPLQIMEVDHEIAACVVAGGNRRSARMSMLPWDDPYIFDFIECKADQTKHWSTNISVVVDDEFLDLLGTDGAADAVLEETAKGMLKNGEPGIWNHSLSQVGEPGEVEATNPCGEITLQPWESCILGHVNMGNMVDPETGTLDRRKVKRSHELMARFLVRSTFSDYTDETQAETVRRNRRIGVGHFGVQEWWVKEGVRYSDAPFCDTIAEDLQDMYATVRQAADDYAFQLRIPAPVKVTTVAPTGTIAKMPGTTEGIHPIYARFFERRIRFSNYDVDQVSKVYEYVEKGYQVEQDMYAPDTSVVVIPTKETLIDKAEEFGYSPDIVESADQICLMDMMKVQALYQENYADNAVSFTVNVPEGRYSIADLTADVTPFLGRVKGLTLFPDKSREQAPYTRLTEEEYNNATNQTVGDGVDENCTTAACPIR